MSVPSHAQEIATLLQNLHQAMHARLWKKTSFDVDRLTIQQVRALQFIKRHPKTPMGNVAGELSITKASVNALVNRLCRSGWLFRTQDTQDRRIYRLALTARAQRRFKTTLARKRLIAENMVSVLSVKDQRYLHRILLQLSNKM